MSVQKKKICLSPYLEVLRSNSDESVNVMNILTTMAHVIDKQVWEILTRFKYGVEKSQLSQYIGGTLFDEYIQKKIIVVQGTEWSIHQPRFIEIETISYCNWKCSYCPNSVFTRAKKVMSITMFNLIMQRAKKYGHIRFISLHGYSEPTIDPFFMDRVKAIKESGFQLVLYTNGSGLTLSVLEKLKSVGATRNIVFNLPSSNPAVFIKRTGMNMFDMVIKNIRTAQRLGFRVNISTQGTAQEQKEETDGIHKMFPDITVKAIPSFDRAGVLKNKYFNNVNHTEERLSGCSFVLTDIHIDVEGRYYLCLEDYHKKNVFGNVNDHSFADFLYSEQYINMVKQIWGNMPAPDAHICRKCILLMKSESSKERKT